MTTSKNVRKKPMITKSEVTKLEVVLPVIGIVTLALLGTSLGYAYGRGSGIKDGVAGAYDQVIIKIDESANGRRTIFLKGGDYHMEAICRPVPSDM